MCECGVCYSYYYSVLTGVPIITEGIQFSRDNLSLTCLSSGGPVSSVEWTRDGPGVALSTRYTFVQTLTDVSTATYANVLMASDITDLVGTFTCSVSNGREPPKPQNTAEIVLNGECSQYNACPQCSCSLFKFLILPCLAKHFVLSFN